MGFEDIWDEPPVVIRHSMTILFTVLYAGLFLYIYAQLILVLVYGHKRWCYRTLLFFICVSWAVLRVTLFSYYIAIENSSYEISTPELSRHVSTVAYFFLYSFPVYLQFCVLCILVTYFCEIVRTSEDIYDVYRIRMDVPTLLIMLTNVGVLAVNAFCAIWIKEHEDSFPAESGVAASGSQTASLRQVIYFRVVINGLTFIAMAVALAYIMVRVAKSAQVRLLLETEHLTVLGARSVGCTLVTLYMCRAIANILALIPEVGWIYDTDQIDFLSDSKHGYYVFVMALFLFEYLPTLATIVFFRVQRPLLLTYPPIIDPLSHPGMHLSDNDEEPSLAQMYSHSSITFHQASDPPWYSSAVLAAGRRYYEQFSGTSLTNTISTAARTLYQNHHPTTYSDLGQDNRGETE